MAVRVRRGHAEGESRTRAMTVCAPALLARIAGASAAVLVFAGAGAGHAAAAPGLPNPSDEPGTASVCVDETHRWGGDITLGAPGAALDTGVDVPPAGGGQISVVGVSADGLDATDHAHVLAVHVGDLPATIGASVSGGTISVISTVDPSVGAVRVVGVTVVVRRCDIVASAPAPMAPPAPPAIGATTALVAGGSISGPSAGPAVLPATGTTPWRQSVIGAVMVAIGCGLISLGRRNATSPSNEVTAGGRGPGSPLGEQRPARG